MQQCSRHHHHRLLLPLTIRLLFLLFLLVPDKADARANTINGYEQHQHQMAQNVVDAFKTHHQEHHQEHEDGKGKVKPAANALASSDHTKIPSGNIHQLFLECTIKHRIRPGAKENVLKTLFAHTALSTHLALFYDNFYSSAHPEEMSYNAFVANASLLKMCAEDVSEAKKPAIKITGEQCSNSNGKSSVTLHLANGEKLVLSPKSGSHLLGSCEGHQLKGSDGQQQTTSPTYQIYKCNDPQCGHVKLVLTQRLGRFDIRQSYYAEGEEAKLECLRKVCGNGRDIQEVGTQFWREDGPKRHRLFRECAVRRKQGNGIETLVKFLPLDEDQTVFFSKGERVYVTQRTRVVRKHCENNRKANLSSQIQVDHAVLSLDHATGKLMFKPEQKHHQQKGQSTATGEVLGISPRGKDRSLNCAAHVKNEGVKNGVYNVFLCPGNICGGEDRLLLVRKTNKKSSTGKRGKQEKRVMNMADGKEHVNVDHVFVVSAGGEQPEEVIGRVLQRCKGSISVVGGLEHHTSSSPDDASDHHDEEKGEEQSQKKKEKKAADVGKLHPPVVGEGAMEEEDKKNGGLLHHQQ